MVDPYDVLKRFSVDTFRFFLMREAPFGGDVTFSETALALRHNAELADTFGNLVHRALALCAKYNGGKVPDAGADPVIDVAALRAASEAAMAAHQLDSATGLAIAALNACNKYLTDTEPWHLKADDPKRLVVVRTTLEGIYAAAHFLQPLLISGAATVFERLNTPAVPIVKLAGDLSNLKPGTQTNGGDILYQKVETAEALALQAEEAAKKKQAIEAAARKRAAAEKDAKEGGGAEASEFSKLDLRVGKIVEVVRHAEADSLYVEKIDIGEGAPRQVVSGLVKFVPIEQMQGRRVVVVANMKPSKLKGVESQAMVLCGKAQTTDAEGKANVSAMELIEPPEGVPLGERVTCDGHAAEPEKQLNPKKKVWEKIQPTLNTSADCVVRWGELPFNTSCGPCKVASIANGAIG